MGSCFSRQISGYTKLILGGEAINEGNMGVRFEVAREF